jgi:hypothetical protein
MKTYTVRGVDYVHLVDGTAPGLTHCTRCPAAPIDENTISCTDMQYEAGTSLGACSNPHRSFVPVHEWVAWRLSQEVT